MVDWREELARAAQAFRFRPACRRFYFLRHGQTEHNRRRICQGQHDSKLNERGRAQAIAAAAIFARHPPIAIAASDLSRVQDTVRPIATRLGLAVRADRGLRERSFGVLENRPVEGRLWDSEAAGVEPLAAFVTRTLQAADAALQHDDVLLAAHGGNLRVLTAALGVAMQPWGLTNAMPIRFSQAGRRWIAAALLDDAAHALDGTAPAPLAAAG